MILTGSSNPCPQAQTNSDAQANANNNNKGNKNNNKDNTNKKKGGKNDKGSEGKPANNTNSKKNSKKTEKNSNTNKEKREEIQQKGNPKKKENDRPKGGNEKNATKNKNRNSNKTTSQKSSKPSVPPNQPQQTSDINYGKGENITILHVGEKPSIAEAIAKGLCKGDRNVNKKVMPVHTFTNPSFPKAPHAKKVSKSRSKQKPKSCRGYKRFLDCKWFLSHVVFSIFLPFQVVHKVTSVAGHVFSGKFH